MIFKYQSKNYSELIDNLKKFFETHNKDIKENPSLNTLVEIILHIIDCNIPENLDNLKLKYNSWNNENEAMNKNLLSYENTILFNIYSENKNRIASLQDVIESIYLVLYADIYEASLITPNSFDRNMLITSSESLVSISKYLSEKSFKKLTHLWFIIPREVFTKHLNQHLEKDVLDTVEKLKINEEFITEKLTASNKLKSDIEKIENSLSKQRKEYNFVGLSKGFQQLKSNKDTDLKNTKYILYALMGLIFAIIIAKIIVSIILFSKYNIDIFGYTIISVSLIFLILILLYFFRVYLNELKSIKSQILQIELRMTLCQFIHNYNSETKELRDGMKDCFEKFETVIFAPIVATEDKIPTTFEGLEQITGMLNLVKKD